MEIKTDPNSIWTIKDFGNYGKDGGDFSGPNPDQFSMDFENSKGGGIPQAFKTIKEWYAKYGLSHWIIEENGFQKAIGQDKEIRNWAATNGVRIEGHQTYKNKWDPWDSKKIKNFSSKALGIHVVSHQISQMRFLL